MNKLTAWARHSAKAIVGAAVAGATPAITKALEDVQPLLTGAGAALVAGILVWWKANGPKPT